MLKAFVNRDDLVLQCVSRERAEGCPTAAGTRNPCSTTTVPSPNWVVMFFAPMNFPSQVGCCIATAYDDLSSSYSEKYVRDSSWWFPAADSETMPPFPAPISTPNAMGHYPT